MIYFKLSKNRQKSQESFRISSNWSRKLPKIQVFYLSVLIRTKMVKNAPLWSVQHTSGQRFLFFISKAFVCFTFCVLECLQPCISGRSLRHLPDHFLFILLIEEEVCQHYNAIYTSSAVVHSVKFHEFYFFHFRRIWFKIEEENVV